MMRFVFVWLFFLIFFFSHFFLQAQNVALSDNGTQVVAADVIKGATSHIIYKIALATTGGSPNLNSVQFNSAGTYATADIVNIKCRFSTDATLDAGDATLSTYTAPPTAGLLTFPSFTSTSLPSGTTRYLFFTIDVSASATVGRTIRVSSFGTGNMTVSAGTKSGSSSAGGFQTIVYPAVTLANNGSQVAAANVAPATTAHVLHRISLAVSSYSTTLTGMQCVTAGTYLAADITNLKVRYSSDASLDAGDATLSTYASPGTAGTKVFPSFTSQSIDNGATGYVFITADIASGAVAAGTIRVNGMATTDLTFSAATVSGSSSASGYQTFTVPSITLANNGTQVGAASVAQGTSSHVLHKLSLAVTNAGATLSGLQCVTAGTYISSDILNLKAWYSADATLDGGDAVLSTYTTPGTAGTKVFPSFTSQLITSGTTGYVFITTDIFPGASAGRTINVNAVGTGDITFLSGSESGSTNAGGAQTFSGYTYTNIYPVTSTADAGAGTLRQAIADANGSAGRDYIYFSLGAGGPFTINLTSYTVFGVSHNMALTLSDNSGATIDGWTNTGNNGTPNSVAVASVTSSTPMNPTYKVILTTNNAPNSIFHLTGNNNIIKGLILNNYGDNPTELKDIAIVIGGNNNLVLGCFIGTNSAGTAIGGSYQASGVHIYGSNNEIGDGTAAGANLMGGSTWSSGVGGAVRMAYHTPQGVAGSGCTGNVVKGNMIGLQVDGTNQIPTGGDLSAIGIGYSGTAVSGNTIGGTTAGYGNVISGFVTGIYLAGNASTNYVYGNIIGPAADGQTYVTGNRQNTGIYIAGPSNIIGGNTANHRNIISGNEINGIVIGRISGSNATGNSVLGNYIGPSSALTNFRTGGGSTGGKGGLSLNGLSNQDYGIVITNDASNNAIGGFGATDGNIIAYNLYDGIYISDLGSTGNRINRNLIYNNSATGKPINLNYGPTQGNAGKAMPVLTSFTGAGVSGTSGALDYIEVFKNNGGTQYDASTYVGATFADGAGNWSLAAAFVAGDRVLMNAGSSTNNTSEFTIGSTPLPVSLLYFLPVCGSSGDVVCSWSTASEINNDFFTVQSSVNGMDWQDRGTIDGAGTISTTREYEFTDVSVSVNEGGLYYRLVQTDFDGAKEYFPVTSVKCGESAGVQLFPNPATDGFVNLYLNEQKGKEVLIVVIDVNGKEDYLKTFIPEQKNDVITLEFRDKLAPGMYFVKASSEDKMLSRKLIVK